MTLTITIEMNSTAFTDTGNGNGHEVRGILRRIARDVDGVILKEGYETPLEDYKGNIVGKVVVTS